MPDRLTIYREALRNLGAERMVSLTEVRPERVLLDDAWDLTVQTLLSEGLWNFATRTAQLSFDADIEVYVGYEYGFRKPDDLIRTAGVSQDGMFNDGFELWKDEANYLFANIPTIYLEYISSDGEYGLNVGRWSEQFARAVAAYLSFQVALPITTNEATQNKCWQLYKRLLKDAKALDATEDRIRRPPVGRLVKARFANRVTSTDRGIN